MLTPEQALEIIKQKYPKAIINKYIKDEIILEEKETICEDEWISDCRELLLIFKYNGKILIKKEYFEMYKHNEKWQFDPDSRYNEVLGLIDNDLFEIKKFLDIEITFEDIVEYVKSLNLEFISYTDYSIIINYKNKQFCYADNSSMAINYEDEGILLYWSLPLYELYNQIKLKIKNIEQDNE